MNPISLMRIMYAPCGYAHADHRLIPGVKLEQLPSSVANQLLIDHLGLHTRVAFGMPADSVARRCLDVWPHLPRICFLMGARRLRATLVEKGHLLRLDARARQFLYLPVAIRDDKPWPAPGPDEATLCETDLLAAGAACLAGTFHSLPMALRQRLVLLFPRAFDPLLDERLDSDAARRNRWNPSLFSFAVNYALLDASPTS